MVRTRRGGRRRKRRATARSRRRARRSPGTGGIRRRVSRVRGAAPGRAGSGCRRRAGATAAQLPSPTTARAARVRSTSQAAGPAARGRRRVRARARRRPRAARSWWRTASSRASRCSGVVPAASGQASAASSACRARRRPPPCARRGGGPPLGEPAQARPAGERVQPGAPQLGVAEPAALPFRERECVVERGGRGVVLAQHGQAVREQPVQVRLVGAGGRRGPSRAGADARRSPRRRGAGSALGRRRCRRCAPVVCEGDSGLLITRRR